MVSGNTPADVSRAVSIAILKPTKPTVQINHRGQRPWLSGTLVQTMDLSRLLSLTTWRKMDDDRQTLDTDVFKKNWTTALSSGLSSISPQLHPGTDDRISSFRFVASCLHIHFSFSAGCEWI